MSNEIKFVTAEGQELLFRETDTGVEVSITVGMGQCVVVNITNEDADNLTWWLEKV